MKFPRLRLTYETVFWTNRDRNELMDLAGKYDIVARIRVVDDNYNARVWPKCERTSYGIVKYARTYNSDVARSAETLEEAEDFVLQTLVACGLLDPLTLLCAEVDIHATQDK